MGPGAVAYSDCSPHHTNLLRNTLVIESRVLYSLLKLRVTSGPSQHQPHNTRPAAISLTRYVVLFGNDLLLRPYICMHPREPMYIVGVFSCVFNSTLSIAWSFGSTMRCHVLQVGTGDVADPSNIINTSCNLLGSSGAGRLSYDPAWNPRSRNFDKIFQSPTTKLQLT